MLTNAKPISLYQPRLNNISILILGNTPLGNSMKKMTPTVLITNQAIPLSVSCENIGKPGMVTVIGPASIPSVIISSGMAARS